MSWSNIRAIFRNLFEKELSTHLGPSKEALISMYHGLSREQYSITGSWHALKDAIEAKAAELSIIFTTKDLLDVEVDSDSTLRGDDIAKTPKLPKQKTIPKIGFRS